MSYCEHALTFDCVGETLVGVLATPAAADEADVGVVIVVGGPQVRAGSHRQFTLLARHLAAAGYPVLRFDVRGMGDSTGAPRDFKALDEDIACAIRALQQHRPSVQRVVLWGLCDGASAALLFADQGADARLAGLCLLNPWVRSDASLARTHVKHYYLQRLREAEFWRKLLRGGVARRAATELVHNLRQALRRPSAEAAGPVPFQQRMARAWAAFDGPVLLMLSGNDYTAREFVEFTRDDPIWRANLARQQVARVEFAGADHTCSANADRCRMEAATLKWLHTALPWRRQAHGGGASPTSFSAELV
jgi:exosortase A-associated hydrolase 1